MYGTPQSIQQSQFAHRVDEMTLRFVNILCKEESLPWDAARPIVTFARGDESVPEFVVKGHGETLYAKYSQVWGNEVNTQLFGRISLYRKDLDGKFRDSLLSLFISTDGRFSVDGTLQMYWRFVEEHGEINKEARIGTMQAIVEAIQRNLDVIK